MYTDRAQKHKIEDPKPGSSNLRSQLDVMDSVLSSVATKLVILEATRWVQNEVDNSEQRWFGLLRKQLAHHVKGVRWVFST